MMMMYKYHALQLWFEKFLDNCIFNPRSANMVLKFHDDGILLELLTFWTYQSSSGLDWTLSLCTGKKPT